MAQEQPPEGSEAAESGEPRRRRERRKLIDLTRRERGLPERRTWPIDRRLSEGGDPPEESP